MSGIDWRKDNNRQRMQRQGVEDKAGPSKDALRRDADRLLAGYTGPVTKFPPGPSGNVARLVTVHLDSEATVRSDRKVESTTSKAWKSKGHKAQTDLFGTARKSFPNRGKSAQCANIDRAVPPGLVIYCDGACEPNPGTGGWGFAVYRDGVEIHADCGGSDATTNNIMELTGALRALEWIEEHAGGQTVRLFCDSMYVVNGCNNWRHGWKKKGWRRGVEKELANAELWKALDALLVRIPTQLEWCKGHAGIIGNERADELSLMGREAVIEVKPDPLDLIRQQLDYRY